MNLATSINPPVVLPRAVWRARTDGKGLRAERGTWCPLKGEYEGGSVIVPMVSCPKCEKATVLVPNQQVAGQLRRMGLQLPDHQPLFDIDRMGKVTAKSWISGEFSCQCGLRRTIYLDRWQHEKPLWAVAYVQPPSDAVEFVYVHASSYREALQHFGVRGKRTVIEAGPAVGFFTDEKTGAQHV
jgi:hypothetical protein